MKGKGPEAWHAQVLREEADALTAAVRMLEWRDGYAAGWDHRQDDADWRAGVAS
jgi:hypothetical protein